jgi:hypothetical protein
MHQRLEGRLVIALAGRVGRRPSRLLQAEE